MNPSLIPSPNPATVDALASLASVVCPVAPPGAQSYVDSLTGNVLWGVGLLFVVGLFLSLAAILAGRAFSMPQVSKAGVIGVVVIFAVAIGYLVLPTMLRSILGSGCVG